MIIGGKSFNNTTTYIMGILNVTPDSFSDGGRYNGIDSALFHAQEMVSDGAAVIDVGGESTRPGYTQISDEEEIDRVCPVIERIKKELDVPVSLDTYKSAVAMAGIQAGADLINDIWGLQYDSRMASVIAGAGLACCLMHNRDNTDYNSFMDDLINDMKKCIADALQAGIEKDRIILDPGVGFAKSFEQNLMAVKHLDRLCELGFPVLLGTSRKSVIGNALNLPKDEREEGTIATSVMAAMNRCMFVRVHDVRANYRAVKMAEAIMNCD